MTGDETSRDIQLPIEKRARPQYGEYATPQDQANAIATSLPPVSPALLPTAQGERIRSDPTPHSTTTPPSDPTPHSDATPHSTTTPHGTAGAPDPATRIASPSAASAAPAAPTSRRWDLVLSVGLLVYGFLNVVSGLFQYIDLGAYLDEVYSTFGIGDYAGSAADRPTGILIAASTVVSFALADWFTTKRLRAGRIAFWVPIAAGLVATLVSVVLLGFLLTNDPVWMSYIDGLLKK